MMKERFEAESNSNVLFVTAQCSNRCIMCCEPPKTENDLEFCLRRNVRLIETAPKDTREVCVTGGEPTINHRMFLELIRKIRVSLPNTSIHVLSNGRSFKDADFTRSTAEAGGGRLIMGIPLHSDFYGDHDFIAGAKGAWRDTMWGLYSLQENGIPIELRIVINRQNCRRLRRMADFICKTLPFVSWVALMAMEDTGWARKNHDLVWAEPQDFMEELCGAADILDGFGIGTAFYNIPLCLIPENYRRFASKSISDWKTRFTDACSGCSMKDGCCGLFATSKAEFRGIRAL